MMFPYCLDCGQVVKPDVTLYEEQPLLIWMFFSPSGSRLSES